MFAVIVVSVIMLVLNFNKGEKFTKKYPEKVVFKDIDGEKVSIDTNNFLHYQSGSILWDDIY